MLIINYVSVCYFPMQNVVNKTLTAFNRLIFRHLHTYLWATKIFRATNQQQICKKTVFSADFRSKYNAFRCAYQITLPISSYGKKERPNHHLGSRDVSTQYWYSNQRCKGSVSFWKHQSKTKISCRTHRFRCKGRTGVFRWRSLRSLLEYLHPSVSVCCTP